MEYGGTIEAGGVIGAWDVDDAGVLRIVCGSPAQAIDLVRGLGAGTERLNRGEWTYTVIDMTPSPRKGKRKPHG